MDSNYTYGNMTQQSRDSDMYQYPRPYLPYNNPASTNDDGINEEEYNPESLQNHAGSTAPSSRPQAPSISLPDPKALQQFHAVKLHIKTSDWSFDFEGPYQALHKILESLGSIAEHLSHRE